MGLPARPLLGTVMVPQDLQSGSVGPSLLISSLLVCTIVALPDPRLSNGFPRYQEPEEDLSLDLLVPDYSQQVVRLPLTFKKMTIWIFFQSWNQKHASLLSTRKTVSTC